MIELGKLSAKYESNGDPGTVSHTDGDAGGASYGCYQFATSAGVPQDFVRYCFSQGYKLTFILAQADSETDEFDAAWQKCAADDPEGFEQMQDNYVKSVYFDKAVDLLKEIGFDILQRSLTLQQVLWSRAVQYSARWMPELFFKAAEMSGKELNDCTDRELIVNIYGVNTSDESWTSGSPSLRPGLFARFESERDDALNMLG